MTRKSQEAGDRTQSNRDPKKNMWAFCNPFSLVLSGTIIA